MNPIGVQRDPLVVGEACLEKVEEKKVGAVAAQALLTVNTYELVDVFSSKRALVALVSDGSKQYVMKTLLGAGRSERISQQILEEAQILQEIGAQGGKEHHIIQQERLEEVRGRPALLLMHVKGRNLVDSMQETGGEGFLLWQLENMAFQVLKALAFLASLDITHGDVKPDNLLLSGGGKVTLIDFGFAFKGRRERPKGGTDYYFSPEELSGYPVGPASDVWKAAVTFLALYTGRLIFTCDPEKLIRKHEKVLGKVYPEHLRGRFYPKRSSEDALSQENYALRSMLTAAAAKVDDGELVSHLWGTMERMLELDPNQRMTAEKALPGIRIL